MLRGCWCPERSGMSFLRNVQRLCDQGPVGARFNNLL